MMVGRAVSLTVEKEPATPGASPRSSSTTSRSIDPIGQLVVNNVSFDVSAPARSSPSPGCRATARPSSPRRSSGCSRASRARSSSTASDLQGRSRRKVLDAGVGFVPEDRNEDGLVGEFSIAGEPDARPVDGRAVRQGRHHRGLATSTSSPTRRCASSTCARRAIDTKVGRLSGGNQQKVVLARELSRDLRLFVAAQPTRGLDVGSIEFVHKRIVATRDAGVPGDRGVDRARRGGGARRPHRRDVPGRDRRNRAGEHVARRARPDDGRRARRSRQEQQHDRDPARPASPWRRPSPRRPAGEAGERRPLEQGRPRHHGRHAVVISILAVVLALVVGAILIAADRPRRAEGRRLLLRPARRHVRGDLELGVERVHLDVPGRDLQLRPRRHSQRASGR